MERLPESPQPDRQAGPIIAAAGGRYQKIPTHQGNKGKVKLIGSGTETWEGEALTRLRSVKSARAGAAMRSDWPKWSRQMA